MAVAAGEEKPTLLEYPDVIKQEQELLRDRRAKIMGEPHAAQLEDNTFGIALSGGGIRSATINLGFLKTLHKFGLLKQADYLSSVSGGGYTNAYIQATLKKTGDYDALFQDEHIEYMRGRGEYLFPGTGLLKLWNQITLVVSFLVSWIMSLLAPAIMILIGWGIYDFIQHRELLNTIAYAGYKTSLLEIVFWVMVGIVFIHFLFNVTLVYNLYTSAFFNRIETIALGLAGLSLIGGYFFYLKQPQAIDFPALVPYIGIGVALLIFGLFANPNASSFHRFYRKQLADAFLHFSDEFRNVALHKLHEKGSDKTNDYLAPYPLINTTLNLQASKDPNFQGSKASDYFLLSPLFSGSKLTGYVPTGTSTGYSNMTLPAATTISAAAVNPGMGSYSNKILSILTTVLNLRLGFWVWNPDKLHKTYPIVWWPAYFFYELFSRIGTDKKMVNISDGGHIENLAVMELLRRKCKLIVAIDAGSDPAYLFSDLENMTVRARNQLGIDIRFREDQIPEEVIRPNPSHGYSRRRFAVADLYQLWEKKVINGEEVIEHYEDKKVGTFVYVKSSVVAPKGRPDISRDEHLKYGTYKYKIYHPAFPHESTSDQFFDPIQWESYYQLGQFLAADVLGVDNLNNFDVDHAFTIPLDEFMACCDKNQQLFGAVQLPMPSTTSRGLEQAEPEVIEPYEDTTAPPTYEM